MKKDALIGRLVEATIFGKKQEVKIIDKVRTTITVCGQDELGDAYLVADGAGTLIKIEIDQVNKLVIQPEFELPDFSGTPLDRTAQAIVLLEAIYYDDQVDDVWIHESINVLKKRQAELKRKPAGPGILRLKSKVSDAPPPAPEPIKYESDELPLVDITFEQMEQNQELLIEWTDGTENWRICCFDPMYGKDEWQAYSELFKDTRVLTRKFVNRIRKHA